MNVAELIAELDALRPELAGYLVAKGVSAAETEGLASLVDKVASISTGSGGIIPTGTLDIVSNGTVDVAAYAMANVNVPTTEITLQEKSVTPTVDAQTVVADEGYDGLRSVEIAAIATVAQATPSISVSSSGRITATVSQSEGYVSQGTQTAETQLTVQAAKTVTPTTSNQTAVSSGKYTTGDIMVKGDANLVPANIKSGVSIFGVTGTAGSSIQSGSKTVTEDDVEEGTYTKFTVTATGSTVDLAVAWICSVGSTRTRLYVALIVDGTVVKEDVGDYHTNSISLSGRKISFSIADDEVLDYGDYTVYWKIVSH